MIKISQQNRVSDQTCLNPETVFCGASSGISVNPREGPGHSVTLAPVSNFYGSKSKSKKSDPPATPPPSVCSSRASPILRNIPHKELDNDHLVHVRVVNVDQKSPDFMTVHRSGH